MGFQEAIRVCLSKYVTFSGRARRSEYWYFYLFTVLGGLVLGIIDGILGAAIGGVFMAGILGTLFSLAMLLPTLAAACRRLHDTNRSGWWQLLPVAGAVLFIPGIAMGAVTGSGGLSIVLIAIGAIAMIGLVILLIVWLATDSDKDANRFGPSPKYDSIEDTFA